MDPNESLEEIRRLVSEDHHSRLAELIDALDEWIVSGGFLPSDWRKAQ